MVESHMLLLCLYTLSTFILLISINVLLYMASTVLSGVFTKTLYCYLTYSHYTIFIDQGYFFRICFFFLYCVILYHIYNHMLYTVNMVIVNGPDIGPQLLSIEDQSLTVL